MSQPNRVADEQAAQAVVRHHSELAAALTGHVARLAVRDVSGSTAIPRR
ncbi:hypothetical protein [Actinoplanes sp. ATCC 53533]|nr:hypothetical protein [Actinoplanes sp. ATCC 53533]